LAVAISPGQWIVFLAGVTLLGVGLVLWRLERRKPQLLVVSPAVRRWALPVSLILVLFFGTLSFFIPPP
jgi:hypothetical protein